MADGSWISNSSTTWENTAAWSGGVIADGAGFTATFTNDITANRSVSLGLSHTIGNMTLSDAATVFNRTFSAAGAQALTLDNLSSTPVISVSTPVFFQMAVKGSSGFSKTGAGQLTFAVSTPANNTLTGTVAISQGSIRYGNGSYSLVGDLSTVSVTQLAGNNVTVASGAYLEIAGVNPANSNPAFTGNYSGDGYVWVWGGAQAATWVSPGIQFTGSLASLGPATPAKGTGLYLANNQNNQRGIVTAIDVPRVVNFFNGAGATATNFLQSFELASSAVGATYPTKIYIWSYGSAAVSLPANSQRFLANQSTGAIVLTGGVERTDDLTGDADTLTLTLGGTNTLDNTLSGAITTTAGSGPLAIGKINAGRWILSNAGNTYTGGVAISAGTLVAAASGAFGTGNVTVAASSTAELRGGSTLPNNFTSVQGTGDSSNGAIHNAADNNTLSGTITLAAAATIKTAASTTLTLSGALAGSNTLNKTGTGILKLTGTSTGTGATNVNEGTLYINTTSPTGLPTGLLTVASGATLAAHTGDGARGVVPGAITLAASSTLRFGAAA